MNKLTKHSNTSLPQAIDPEIESNLTYFSEVSQDAFAPNTERARRSDWTIFVNWCAQQNITALPASAITVAFFIDEMSKKRTPATVRRYISTLATAHSAAKVANPTEDAAVKLALQRLARNHLTRQKQATPINWHNIEHAISQLGHHCRDMRDKALVLTAYDTLCRRSELTELRVEDFSIFENGSGTILLRKGKSDQAGEGKQKFIAPTTVLTLTLWLDAAKIHQGPIFRGVYKSGKIGAALSSEGVHRALKRIAKLAGLDPRNVSGHSCRVGATQDMVAAGIDLANIMQAGDWKSPSMPARYAEQLLANRGGMAQLAKKQGR